MEIKTVYNSHTPLPILRNKYRLWGKESISALRCIVLWDSGRNSSVKSIEVTATGRSNSGKKCLALDLDETLVHSSFQPVENASFVISVVIEGLVHNVFVLKRPGNCHQSSCALF